MAAFSVLPDHGRGEVRWARPLRYRLTGMNSKSVQAEGLPARSLNVADPLPRLLKARPDARYIMMLRAYPRLLKARPDSPIQ